MKTFEEVKEEFSKYDWRYRHRLPVMIAMNGRFTSFEYNEIYNAMKWRADKDNPDVEKIIEWLNK